MEKKLLCLPTSRTASTIYTGTATCRKPGMAINQLKPKYILIILTILMFSCTESIEKQPRVFIFTDYNGPVEWDYSNPCNTWENHVEMANHAKSTLEKVRPEMYKDLLTKLDKVYSIKNSISDE